MRRAGLAVLTTAAFLALDSGMGLAQDFGRDRESEIKRLEKLVIVGSPDPARKETKETYRSTLPCKVSYTETGKWGNSILKDPSGTHYRLAKAGEDSTARWSAILPADTYLIETIISTNDGNERTRALVKYLIEIPRGDSSIKLYPAINHYSLNNDRTWLPLGEVHLRDGKVNVILDARQNSGQGVFAAGPVRLTSEDGYAYIATTPRNIPATAEQPTSTVPADYNSSRSLSLGSADIASTHKTDVQAELKK